MYIVYLLTIVMGSIYFTCRSRRFDFLSVFFFSGLLYTPHALIGHIEASLSYGYFYYEFSPKAYLILVCFFAVVLVGAVLHDWLAPRHDSPQFVENRINPRCFALMAVGGVLVGAASLMITLWHDPTYILFGNKKIEWMQALGRAFVLYQFSVIFAIVAAYLSRKLSILLIAAVLGAVDLYIGFRMVFAMSFLGILVAESGRHEVKPLYQRWRLCLTAVTGLVCMIAIKNLYVAIKIQDTDLLNQRINLLIQNPLGAFLSNEMVGPTIIFLSGIENKIHLGYRHLMSSFWSFVPLANELGKIPRTYNFYVQEPILGVSQELVGFAESNFGAWYATGGLTGVIFFTSFYTGLTVLFTILLRRARWSYPLLLVWLPFFTFYNFRNDFPQIFIHTKRVVLMWLVLMLFTIVMLCPWTATRPRRQLPPNSGMRQDLLKSR